MTLSYGGRPIASKRQYGIRVGSCKIDGLCRSVPHVRSAGRYDGAIAFYCRRCGQRLR